MVPRCPGRGAPALADRGLQLHHVMMPQGATDCRQNPRLKVPCHSMPRPLLKLAFTENACQVGILESGALVLGPSFGLSLGN